ncbi:TetR/AcrR family transcriptional regulator [Ruania zhangjianzhongii]|uniref:TetR/AcrR family transcriptional regulator n=1 Tax=Ruania zhangjianzhongii TaxID=2603206 RepID=UPI0011CBCD3E|nr:TetR/AcrR family transcriptional regulator [Ruania zhangjianzhongii]
MDAQSIDHATLDLTARARVRNVALRMFAEHGVAGASLRAVAQEAGVSTGLVQHHFGSKAGLRRACDEYAVGQYLELASGAAAGHAQPGFAVASTAATELSTRYLARVLVEGSAAADELFDSGVDVAERWLSSRWPDRFPVGSARARDAAAVMGAMHLSTLVLHRHLSRQLGIDTLGDVRVPAALVDVYQAMASFLATPEGRRLRNEYPPRAEETDDE